MMYEGKGRSDVVKGSIQLKIRLFHLRSVLTNIHPPKTILRALLTLALPPTFDLPFDHHCQTDLLFTMAFETNETLSRRLSSGAIMYLIHHIFLPPKLPHEDDSNAEYETILLDIAVDGLSKLKDYVGSEQKGVIDSVIAMVISLKTVRDSFGSVNERKLENEMENLCKKGVFRSHTAVPAHSNIQRWNDCASHRRPECRYHDQ